MTKEEFIKEAKRLNYSDKEIQSYIDLENEVKCGYELFPLFYQEPNYLKSEEK